MDKELQQELEWINENLKTVVMNENMMYSRLNEIETRLKEQKNDIDNKA